MPLEPATALLGHAFRNQYAIGYFEAWDIASLEGVIDAAEQTRSPVIVGFNGEFLGRPDRALSTRLEWYGALGRAAAESAQVPCAVMFNECSVDSWVERATRLGFNLVMLADENAEYSDLIRRVAKLVNLAHAQGVAVEAELGTLPYCTTTQIDAQELLTDPDQAVGFVRETGVDLLGVSVGNVHVLLDGSIDLDLTQLAEIHKKVDIPLVLHGGTGIATASLSQAISLGVAKVNYGTCLKQRSLRAIQESLLQADANPHHVLGDGGDADLMVVVRRAAREAVLERIGTLGCCGKA